MQTKLKSMAKKSLKTKVVVFKCTDKDFSAMKKNAKKHHATLSQWLRDAGCKWIPSADDLVGAPHP